MRLSRLQKHILTQCYSNKNSAKLKSDFYNFYPKKDLKKNKLGIQVSLQKSFDNMVEKDYIIAYGHKTARKWYVNKIKLTVKGRKLAKTLIKGRQRRLPIK